MVRRSLCSTSAPSMFWETSHSPMPMPKKNRATAVPGIDSAEQGERQSRLPPGRPARRRSVRCWRCRSCPPPVPPSEAPAASRRRCTAAGCPSGPEVMCSVSVTAGIRAAQLAKTRPLMPKTTNVAAAAAEARVRPRSGDVSLHAGRLAPVGSFTHCLHWIRSLTYCANHRRSLTLRRERASAVKPAGSERASGVSGRAPRAFRPTPARRIRRPCRRSRTPGSGRTCGRTSGRG